MGSIHLPNKYFHFSRFIKKYFQDTSTLDGNLQYGEAWVHKTLFPVKMLIFIH